MKTDYKITRDKFMDDKEKSELDLMKGCITWVVRYIFVNLALYSSLRVSEIAKLKIKDLNFDKVDDTKITVLKIDTDQIKCQ